MVLAFYDPQTQWNISRWMDVKKKRHTWYFISCQTSFYFCSCSFFFSPIVPWWYQTVGQCVSCNWWDRPRSIGCCLLTRRMGSSWGDSWDIFHHCLFPAEWEIHYRLPWGGGVGSGRAGDRSGPGQQKKGTVHLYNPVSMLQNKGYLVV